MKESEYLLDGYSPIEEIQKTIIVVYPKSREEVVVYLEYDRKHPEIIVEFRGPVEKENDK